MLKTKNLCHFNIIFKKSIDIFKKILYYVYEKEMMNIDTLINIFFIISFITFFITFYSIYSFFEIYFFHHMQGSKLNIKNKLNS